jgi:hypothetical protein
MSFLISVQSIYDLERRINGTVDDIVIIQTCIHYNICGISESPKPVKFLSDRGLRVDTPAHGTRFWLLCEEGSISELGEMKPRHKSSDKPLDDYRTEFSTSMILFIFYFHIISQRISLYLVIKIVTRPIIVTDLI